MIPADKLDPVLATYGGEWGGNGQLVGQALLDYIAAGKLSMTFADKGVIIGMQTTDGGIGVYPIPYAENPNL